VKRRILLLGGAELFAGAALADENKPVVTIDRATFMPAELEVKVGTEIEWINRDSDEHNVTENTKAFRSPILDTGETWRRVFTEAGTVEYYCSLHPHMTGRIRVVA
jgi:plastocyanin